MNREQCEGCAYFVAGYGGYRHDTLRFCHYMLYTGQRRKVGKKEKCLSKSTKVEKACPAFELPSGQL